MSVATDSYPAESKTSNTSDLDNRQAGFKAANGHSTSRQNGDANASSSDSSGSDSGFSSPGKRKADTSPSSNSFSPKRVRRSPAPTNARGDKDQGSHSAPVSGGWTDEQRQGSSNSDIHLAQVLSTDIGGPQMTEISTSPEQSHHASVLQNDEYHYDGKEEQTPPAVGNVDSTPANHRQASGQRKRVFSNRTKTGCITCRQRKKKCDERKPTCDNCERGQFECKGYSQNTSGYKTPLPHSQLQPTHQQQYPTPYTYQPVQAPAVPYYDHHQQRVHSQAPQDSRLQSSYGHQPQWLTTQPSYPQDPMQRDYPPVASLPSQNLPHPDMSNHISKPTLPQPLPQPIHPPHNRANSQSQPMYGQYNGPNGLTNGQSGMAYNTNHLRTTAQLASTHSSDNVILRTEKEKMLAGLPFQHRDPDLEKERTDCQVKVYRFNKNAIEPLNLTKKQKQEQFQQILEPENTGGKKSSSSMRNRLGKDVEVDAPFNCLYGYNIRIGEEVDIGANCRIMDAAPVEIGARTIIGPDVKILTLDGDHRDDAKIRRGEKRLCCAAPISIGSDVFIGAGAIILPGRNIPDGATIGAGTIVYKNPTGPVVTVNGFAADGIRQPRTHWKS